MFVRTGDKVKVIAGKEKDKEGTVIRVGRKDDRIIVKGLNMIKKHEKPSQTSQNGSIVGKGGSIHILSVMLTGPESGRPTRVDHEIAGGNKVCIAKVSGKAIDKG